MGQREKQTMMDDIIFLHICITQTIVILFPDMMLAAFRVFCILPASGGSIDWAHGMITSLHIIYINYIITRSCGDPIQHGHGAERQSGLGTGSQSDYTRGEYHYKDQDTW